MCEIYDGRCGINGVWVAWLQPQGVHHSRSGRLMIRVSNERLSGQYRYESRASLSFSYRHYRRCYIFLPTWVWTCTLMCNPQHNHMHSTKLHFSSSFHPQRLPGLKVFSVLYLAAWSRGRRLHSFTPENLESHALRAPSSSCRNNLQLFVPTAKGILVMDA